MTGAEASPDLDRVAALAGDAGLRAELARMRAKAEFYEILGEAPDFAWAYSPESLVRRAAFLGIFLRQAVNDRGELPEEFAEPALVAARAWEGLGILGERVNRPTAMMNAALGYELAGYQANAACLARLSRRNRTNREAPDVDELAASFVQRLFLRLRVAAPALLQRIERDVNTDGAFPGLVPDHCLVRALDQAALFFLSGTASALETAKEEFASALAGYSALQLAPRANLTANLAAMTVVMAQRSTWKSLGSKHDVPRWQRYLRALSRGLSDSVLDGRSVSELWPSQQAALDHGLLDARDNLVIKMPTSAGKTRIAEMAIVDSILRNPGSKCLYIAPYRALMAEVEGAFSNLFRDIGFGATSIVGAYESGPLDPDLMADSQVVVLTPEKTDLLFRSSPELLADVKLLILDEGQLVGDAERGPRYELLVSRLKLALPEVRIVMLSAVVSEETLQDFAAWLKSGREHVIESAWRPAALRVAKLEWSGTAGHLRYEPSSDDAAMDLFLPKLVQQEEFTYLHPETRRVRNRRFPEPGHRAQVSAALAYTLASRGPVLIFCMQPGWCEAAADALLERIELAERTGAELAPIFRPRDVSRSEVVAREWLGDDHKLVHLLRRGIAFHYGRLPEPVRTAIEDDMRQRTLCVVCATTTLAQGVNLPVRTVIMHSSNRYITEEKRQERLPARDYWNIAGRAGRAGQETDGTVIHLRLNADDESDYAYYLAHRVDVGPMDSGLYRILDRLISRRISPDDAVEMLDAEILGLLLDESKESEELLAEVIDQSLVAIQAERTNRSLEPLLAVFRAGIAGINELVPDPALRRVFAQTGLSARSCTAIAAHINGDRDRISGLLEYALEENIRDLTDLFLSALGALPEMEPRAEFGGSTRELLTRWIEGNRVDALVEEAGQGGDVVEYVEEFFSYLLPWGMSAYLTIGRFVLNLEHVSEVALSVPTLVKYGVPTKQAAWAMSAGVAARQTAIKLGAAFTTSGRSQVPAQFRRWLSTLDPDEAAEDLGIAGAELELTTRAIVRSHASSLLSRVDEGEQLLPLIARVRARSGAKAIASGIEEGEAIDVRRDYESGLNRNSVTLSYRGSDIAFLGRQEAEALGPEMDAGLQVRAIVREVERTDSRLYLTVGLSEAAGPPPP